MEKTKYYNTSVKMCANACKCQMYSANLKWLGIVMIGGEERLDRKEVER